MSLGTIEGAGKQMEACTEDLWRCVGALPCLKALVRNRCEQSLIRCRSTWAGEHALSGMGGTEISMKGLRFRFWSPREIDANFVGGGALRCSLIGCLRQPAAPAWSARAFSVLNIFRLNSRRAGRTMVACVSQGNCRQVIDRLANTSTEVFAHAPSAIPCGYFQGHQPRSS
jgi:hypothetical protein